MTQDAELLVADVRGRSDSDSPIRRLPSSNCYGRLVIIVPYRIVWSWYTGRWWVGCYIWYSEEGLGGAAARWGPSSLYQM